MGWSDHYFYPGGVSGSVASCQSDGPLFVFQKANANATAAQAVQLPTLALSALYNFTLAGVVTGGTPNPKMKQGTSMLGVKTKKPALASSALLLVRPGFNRANRGYGSVLRQFHRTYRRRSLQTDGA